MDEEQAFARAALDLVGAKFRLHGRSPETGLDCVGVVVAGLRAIGRRCELPTGYLLRTGTWPDADAWAQRHSFLPVGGPARPGDVLLMSPGPGQLHLAVVSPDPAMIIEAHALLRKVVLGPAPSPATVLRHWRLIPSL